LAEKKDTNNILKKDRKRLKKAEKTLKPDQRFKSSERRCCKEIRRLDFEDQ
jgi:hypothetical protein